MDFKKPHIVSVLGALLLMLTLVFSSASIGAAQDNGFSVVPDGVQLDSTVSAPLGTTEKASPAAERQAAASVNGLSAVSVFVVFENGVDVSTLEAVSDGEVVHQYSEVFNGVSMVLSADKLDAVDALDGVTAIYLDQLLQPTTDASPEFIGAPVIWDDLGGQQNAGEGVIVGVLDTGIWPEHPSFSDPDPFGNSYPAPPTVPGSNGFGSGGPRNTCDFGNTSYNPDDAPFTCNNKLIGAYKFLDTYIAVQGALGPNDFDSARDSDGHGTHTASTAAGNGGVAAELLDVDRGDVSGIAPRAHVIMYRVCADAGCYQSDSVAAVEQAILDGVASINFSISGGGSPYSDLVEQAFAVAYDNGVFVSASAGNEGPGPETVAHRGPWTMTVGASTSDRHFVSTVSLTADNGDTLTLQGASVTAGISTPTPVVFPPAGEELCLDPFPAGTFNGEIVICERGVIARVAKSYNVAVGGAAGMLQYNPVLQGLATDNHFIPSVHLENDAGEALLDFMGSHSGVMATFTPGEATTVQGDIMGSFSSRGGPNQPLGISKPDITAPGVQILAGHTPMPATVDGGLPGQLFQSIQGTSMSSPHVAGAGALLAALHPDWSPGQIKSALMLSAITRGVTKEDGVTPADPFDYGSGRVNLAVAGDAGLTMDETVDNFFALQDELWNANYPSLYHPNLAGAITVERTVHNESDQPRTWRLIVLDAGDLIIDVPRIIQLEPGGDTTFSITVDARNVPVGEVRHAMLRFKQGNQELSMPITVVRGEADVTVDKSCDPTELALYEFTDCTITVTNNSTQDAAVTVVDQLPRQLRLDPDTLVGATANGNGLVFEGSLFAAGAPIIDISEELSPAGYLPLSLFGIAPAGCPSNCDDGGFIYNTPAFMYNGQSYTQLIWSVNGTVEVGVASGLATSASNHPLPNPSLPNNLLAPWWTDLNLAQGGAWRIGSLTDGVNDFLILDWENVPRYGDNSSTFSFQVWIQTGSVENIWFTYGPSTGDTTDGTVGAENSDGTIGDTYYVDGTGTSVWSGGVELGVNSLPGVPGETHEISYTARGWSAGLWTNCAEVTSDIMQESAISCVSGIVNAPRKVK